MEKGIIPLPHEVFGSSPELPYEVFGDGTVYFNDAAQPQTKDDGVTDGIVDGKPIYSRKK